jgi:molybdopterin-guanine dinucleotide biosynthesis protein A
MNAPSAIRCDGRVAVDVTLGILAGGRASRLGGRDKAWLQRGGKPQVLRLRDVLRAGTSALLVSANRDAARYEAAGLRVVADRHSDIGPLGGLDALAQACATPWLFTVPVDLVDAESDLLGELVGAGGHGAWIEDDAGVQPLVALWRVAALRAALPECIASGSLAVQALQRRLGMHPVRLHGVRLGNLNTVEDLRASGVEPE